MKVIRRIVSMSVLLFLLASCSTTKFVEGDQYLLDKVVIESDNPDFGTSELNSYVRQQPNFKLFGLVKWQLYVYNWSGRNANNWFNKQLRRIGEAPVILDSMLVEQSQAELGRFLFNKGYIDAGLTSSIDTTRRKKAVVTYHITSNEPYRIGEYNSRVDDARIDSIIHLTPVKRSALSNTFRSASENFTPLIKEGNLFDRDVLDEERQRATSLLRRRGYYAFNRDHLGYLADSTHNQHLVDVDLVLKPFRKYHADGSVTEVPHRQYYINNVSILTDYNALDDNLSTRFIPTDTVKNKALTIIYGQRGKNIRSNVLRDAVYLSPGQLYNERNVEQTYSALTSLRALKNVNLRFTEYEENDSLKLDCIVQTSFSKPQSIGFDVEGTNNAGDLGFASSLSYQHRNIFRGAEVFSARIRGAYESLGGSDSYWEYGGEASILFPRFLFPFLDYDFKRRLRASTELRLSYNKQDRPEYERSIFSGSWNYIWQDRSNVLARHTFKLLDVDYVLLPSIDPDFKNSLPEALLRYNYTDQFIVATGYTYSFNNYSPQNRMRNTHSLRVSVETAGNVLYALSNLTKSSKDSNGRYSLFGTNYSQFVKADIDVSRGIVLDNRSRLAFHVGVGVGVPYGNAEMLPFERRYFSGGANSVRGWSVRDLGPGSMAVNDTTSFAYQVGDVRLDLNVEYRTKLFWKFELAAYVDAGNIWTIRPYVDQPDGNFDFSRFYKEIAVSYGLGLRLDFDFFLLRFDTGFKAYNPQERGSKRWAISHPNFGKNFAWHFAVGYPF
ncbi:BamA/TamA family outer membrane protein [Parabacteroides sp. PF5-6]|uniref:translocation and assembly module lipoprotein TamL n=1 Tax=Parabacteroides sp. PF5-6 TaxID=1742403 RepID=UPI002405B866|nr:BamA/TamA family outer membrane protein [Parabacteroides sp. PF5-6]MDF9829650.1 outer membrane protein assembly factor BamA [Parabacteroides sp. PF5-6]